VDEFKVFNSIQQSGLDNCAKKNLFEDLKPHKILECLESLAQRSGENKLWMT
jgi:hypothetical protein